MYNPTIQDLRDGKWSIENTGGTLEDLRKILKYAWPDHNNELNGTAKIYFRIDGSRFLQVDSSSPIPSKPIPYWLSLIDAPEYIYEPFDEEKAKKGAEVVMRQEVITWLATNGRTSAIQTDYKELMLVNNDTLKLRRKVETKVLTANVYEDGYISTYPRLRTHGKLIETFTHTIKMPS